MQSHAQEKGLKLRLDILGPVPVAVEADAIRLRQTLVNLITNAIKFTDQGTITLSLQSKANISTGKLELTFIVEDTGIGIADEHLERIFQPFVQVDDKTERNLGTGLGLSISRNFARLFGGDLVVESEPGKGSRFIMRIDCGDLDDRTCVPAHQFEFNAQNRREQIREKAKMHGLHVHLVEDSASIAILIRHLLEEAGARVTHSVNGKEGLQDVLRFVADDKPPDLVIMDMMMPVMDGHTATSSLRGKGVTVPIIAMTAFTMSDDRKKCLEAGCDAYISKPINPANLIGQLLACIE
jgi:CheY-like chemotaxis protein/anti-sigma regulatory factor (Ser/Thr protein kinase)